MRFRFLFLKRERPLLSKFTGDWTVGILWTKKESCSTRRGLRVDSGFKEFGKLREVGDLSYLGFTLYLSVL